MNIKDAKQQIADAMKAYFTKDEYGNFKIASQSQRPVFLMGPPGIGKTDIMKQVADELGVGLVTYSMTHHTRQSALGLPVIKEKEYDGQKYTVTEYTMSEIIASIYDLMEEGKVKEGILFLDEINCVSETLTPTMLQFLQYKVFGKHKVPDGWLVVAAGNPTEYNRSARDFDIVTWDRLKRIDIDIDYLAWREFAINIGVHPSIITYLDAKKDNFYKIETTVEGKSFVTARSWVDLSDMIKLYEPLELTVDEKLVSQYLQDKDIASDFAIYYDLFNKYKSDYQINDILNGKASDEIKLRAKSASFDERLSLLGLLINSISHELKEVIDEEDYIALLLTYLKNIKEGSSLEKEIENVSEEMVKQEKRGTMTLNKKTRFEKVLVFLKKHVSLKSDFASIKQDYDSELENMKAHADVAKNRLDNLFGFVEENFESGNEMIILLSDLTSNTFCARFISRYGCDAYYRHNEELMFYKRKLSLKDNQ